jgi:hypothetical protein
MVTRTRLNIPFISTLAVLFHSVTVAKHDYIVLSTSVSTVAVPCQFCTAHDHSPQFTAHSPRPTVHSPQPTVHNPQFTAHSSQPTVHSPQFTAHSPQPTVHSPQPTVHSPHFTAHSSHVRKQQYRTLRLLKAIDLALSPGFR